MTQRKRFSRFILLLTLLLALCAGMFSPRVESVEAKPNAAADELNVFISEFRTRGPNGADDEFIEIYNASGGGIDIGNWTIQKSSGCGTTEAILTTIPTGTTLSPGQYYLIVKDGFYSGSTSYDRSYTVAGVADDGGIVIKDASLPAVIIDQVGMCNTTTFKEGTTLSSMSGTANQSYERKSGGSAGSCKDTDNNAADFILNSSTSNPQNYSSPAVPCLAVIKAESSVASPINYLDTSSAVIDIQLTFSNIVTVTGSPTLLMETGTPDRTAIYAGGSGTNTLTFNYTIQPNDNTSDLDYASYNALSLNGGTIFGASGDAVLILPKPNTLGSGSLSDNEDIRIDNTSITPELVSFKLQNPASPYTKAGNGTLVFRITFSEAVLNVDEFDFDIVDSSTILGVSALSITNVEGGRVYDLTIQDANLSTSDGTISLDLPLVYTIDDVDGLPLALVEPAIDEEYIVDNTPPTINIEQATLQVDPVIPPGDDLPINFDLTFDDPIDVTTLTSSDIKQNGNATGITWSIIDSGDHTNFTLSAIASSSGTIEPSIDANKVKDLAGNNNLLPSASTDNSVNYDDIIPPTVTINQVGTQPDPTSALPINFSAQFSEPINIATFTTADITQTGTATSVVWSIINSGDNRNFTLSATSSSYGIIIPSIAANRVTDLSGNNNTASTSTDNTVTFAASSARSVIINEVAWAGTTSSLTSDEWIELYNTTNATINITGWTLKTADGAPTITLNGTIPAGGYFLLERDDDNTVSDITADQIYTGDLSNSGEALSLRDGANVVIDTANGNGGSWPAGSTSTYGTMERNGSSADNDSNWHTNVGTNQNGKNANGGNILGTPKQSNSQAPSLTLTPAKTPIPTSTPIPATAVIDPRPIINEILARPGFDWNQDGETDVFDEFIEIKNLTVIDISLTGWKLDVVVPAGTAAKSFSLPDATLKPGERIVFYSKQTNLLLSDGGETVRLVNSSGKIYDAFTYTIARAEDKSFCRLPDGTPGNSWFEDCIPTPILTNTREGKAPVSPDDSASPFCNLPDTIPLDFFIPECNGYGADIWNPFYWDFTNWIDKLFIHQTDEKWHTFIE